METEKESTDTKGKTMLNAKMQPPTFDVKGMLADITAYLDTSETEIGQLIDVTDRTLRNWKTKGTGGNDLQRLTKLFDLVSIAKSLGVKADVFLAVLENLPLVDGKNTRHFLINDPMNELLVRSFKGLLSEYMETLRPIEGQEKDSLIKDSYERHGFLKARTEHAKVGDMSKEELLKELANWSKDFITSVLNNDPDFAKVAIDKLNADKVTKKLRAKK